VYGLSAPKNYIGVTSMFSDDGAYASQVIDLVDAEVIFPFKHQRDLPVDDLPESLRNAVRAFLISTTVRDLRGEQLRHRSMLVNVTRFTDVQQRVAERVEVELYDLKEEVKQFLAAPGETWKTRPALVALKKTWDDQYADCGYDWDAIRKVMFESVEPIKVLTINQRTAAEQKLNYRLYDKTEKGRRVIAVGGLTLSRGLTLMGLSISYFKRDSKAYDTLLQMGRWFGYRPGYDDLCRVWMPGMVQEWFAHIGEVVSELRSDLLRMHASRQPPRRFGIRVRCHPDLLLITARNKMRHGDEVDVAVSYSGHAAETPYLPARPQDNVDNLGALGEFLSALKPANRKAGSNQLVYRKVGAATVAAFLTKLKIPFENATFSPDQTTAVPLLVFIAAAPNEALREWDVCLAQGEGDPVNSLKVELDDGEDLHPKCRRRQFEKVPAGAGYRKLNKHRVGDVSDEKLDLTETDLKSAQELWELERSKDPELGASIPGRIFRRFRKRPLLTISLVEPGDPKPGSKPSKRSESMMAAKDVGSPTLLALSLSFPIFGDDEAEVVTYRFNTVALRQSGILEDEEDDSDD
jgi:hypothetical protein